MVFWLESWSIMHSRNSTSDSPLVPSVLWSALVVVKHRNKLSWPSTSNSGVSIISKFDRTLRWLINRCKIVMSKRMETSVRKLWGIAWCSNAMIPSLAADRMSSCECLKWPRNTVSTVPWLLKLRARTQAGRHFKLFLLHRDSLCCCCSCYWRCGSPIPRQQSH